MMERNDAPPTAREKPPPMTDHRAMCVDENGKLECVCGIGER